MKDLDLNPYIATAAGRMARGEVADNDRFIARCAGYDTVSWVGVGGTTNVRPVPDPPFFEYTALAREFACVLTDGKVTP